MKNKKVFKILISILFFLFLPSLSFAKISQSEILTLLNQEREKYSLPPLSVNSQLQTAAVQKAEEMFKEGYFDHKSPSLKTISDFLKEQGYQFELAGENLARGFYDAQELHQAWIQSGPHRQNILNPQFEEVGIAIKEGYYKGEKTIFVVEFFGKRRKQNSFLAGVFAGLYSIASLSTSYFFVFDFTFFLHPTFYLWKFDINFV